MTDAQLRAIWKRRVRVLTRHRVQHGRLVKMPDDHWAVRVRSRAGNKRWIFLSADCVVAPSESRLICVDIR